MSPDLLLYVIWLYMMINGFDLRRRYHLKKRVPFSVKKSSSVFSSFL